MREGARFSERVLVGYRVNNNVVVKVRDLNAAGDIIDEAVQAGGDATRVDGLRFTAEDTSEARAAGQGKGRNGRDREGRPACLARRRVQGQAGQLIGEPSIAARNPTTLPGGVSMPPLPWKEAPRR